MQHHWQHCRDQAKESNEPLQLPALDEALVSFILTLMSRYITQYHLIEETNSDLPANAIIYDSDSGYTYEQIKLSLLTDIYKTASKVIYYVSASNWPSCYAKIKNAVMSLDSVNGPSDDIPPEIRMLECSCLTRNKLYTIFSGKERGKRETFWGSFN
jgi:neurofibromin 1